MFYWKQTKPVLKKAYIFHYGRIRKYPDIPTNVPYYTTLSTDIIMYCDGGTKPIFENANTLASKNNYAFQPKNTEKGGILIRYENIEFLSLIKYKEKLVIQPEQEKANSNIPINSSMSDLNQITQNNYTNPHNYL